MEILAPVGNFPAFEAALEEGADAVFIGAPGLNARSLAKDFSFREIGAMIAMARKSGVKTYMAMNSLVKEDEIGAAVESLDMFSRLRPNALIIQDLGLLYLAQTYFPELELHASTLMSAHNSLTVHQLADMGFSRVVLPRELTLEEIGTIARASRVELEIFVHGAMCFSFSGLCMFSSMHGGKSSLRGQCVQPCRRKYQWSENKGRRSDFSLNGYPFSMNDLCGIDVLAQLRDMGVACLKIEGRLKNAEYVRKTVRAYRLALSLLDAPKEQKEAGKQEISGLLDEAMGRRRGSGFFLSSAPEQAVSPMISGTSGLPVGEVTKFHDGVLTVRLSNGISRHDRFRFHGRRAGERVGFAPRKLLVSGQEVTRAESGDTVTMEVRADSFVEVSKGAEGTLYRVDVGARKTAHQSEKKLKVKQAACRISPDQQRITEVLNDLLGKQSTPAKSRSGKQKEKTRGPGGGGAGGEVWVKVRSQADTTMLLPVRPQKFIVELSQRNLKLRSSGKHRKKQASVVWSLPPIILEHEVNQYQRMVNQLIDKGQREFQLGHIGQRGLFVLPSGKLRPGVILYGDYTLNILNSVALRQSRNLGLARVQFSPETDRENMRNALASHRAAGKRQGLFKIGMLTYGHLPLFTARLTGKHLTAGTRFKSPKGERFVLDVHNGLTRVRAEVPFSLLNYQAQLRDCGTDYFIFDLTGGLPKRESTRVADLLNNRGGKRQVLTGNFNGKLL